MSDQDNDLPVTDELTALKARAAMLGVKFHPSISLDKLREKVNAAVTGEAPAAEAAAADDGAVAPAPAPKTETLAQKRKRMKDEAARLVRIRVTCMNPMKRDWEGEIFTVGNAVVGTFRKYVPFNADDGWHVPHIMYEQIVARQCQVFVTEKAKNGVAVRRGKLIKEFAVEVLPQLSPQELDELARRQAMAGSVG